MLGLEYRYYVRHLHANLKEKGWKGKEFKDALWGAAMAPNEVQFKYYLFVIGGMDKKAIEYIEGVNPKIWSRHAFQITSCSDILQNNIAKSFNAWVLEARSRWSNQMQFKVNSTHEARWLVDLQRRTCGCGRW
jgi:hypothetical protein